MSSSTSAPAMPVSSRRSAARRQSSVTTTTPARLPSGRPKTSPSMIALCLLLMLGCGAGAGLLVLSTSDSVTVVAAARDIPAGSTITAADLRAAELSGSGLAAIPGAGARALLGQRVLGPVPQGTLLNASMVTRDPAPAAGTMAVGLALTAGQVPADQLAAGREVQLYRLAERGAGVVPAADAPSNGASVPSSGGGQILVDRAQVLSMLPGTGGGVLLTVQVPGDRALAVSSAGSAGMVAVGLLPLGTG